MIIIPLNICDTQTQLSLVFESGCVKLMVLHQMLVIRPKITHFSAIYLWGNFNSFNIRIARMLLDVIIVIPLYIPNIAGCFDALNTYFVVVVVFISFRERAKQRIVC